MRSFIDNYTKSIAPALRRLNDHQIKILGIEINALILKTTERNKLGDEDTEIKESKTLNARIIYPGNRVTLFRNRDENGNLIEDNAIFLEDILPIELYIPITESYTVEEGDILVHVLLDEKNNPIPQVFKIARSTGMFNNRELIAKIFILSNIRDILNEDIRNQISIFVTNFMATQNIYIPITSSSSETIIVPQSTPITIIQSTPVEWGDITGNIRDQIDLKTALDAKANTNHTHQLKNLIDDSSHRTVTDAEKVNWNIGTRIIGENLIIDIINNTATLQHIPLSGTLSIFLNGLLCNEGENEDYTIVGNIVTFNNPSGLVENDTVKANYNY